MEGVRLECEMCREDGVVLRLLPWRGATEKGNCVVYQGSEIRPWWTDSEAQKHDEGRDKPKRGGERLAQARECS